MVMNKGVEKMEFSIKFDLVRFSFMNIHNNVVVIPQHFTTFFTTIS